MSDLELQEHCEMIGQIKAYENVMTILEEGLDSLSEREIAGFIKAYRIVQQEQLNIHQQAKKLLNGKDERVVSGATAG